MAPSGSARRLALASLVLVVTTLAVSPSLSHDDGTDEFPCIEGPFGVPGLQLPAAQIGEWSPVMSWPEQATHVIVLPTGKVLWWRGEAPLGVASTTYLWNPSDDSMETRQLLASNTFCSGHASLGDGRVIVQGGTADPARQIDGVPDTNLFDPWTETWIRVADTATARWYPTLTTLSDGRILATSGLVFATPRIDATIPEVYDPATNQWSEWPTAELQQNLYPVSFLLPDGRLFFNANFRATLTLDLDTQQWTNIGNSNFAHVEGTGAMVRPGKIVRLGGGDIGIAAVEVIDMNDPAPVWRSVAPLEFPRRRPDLVLLPDGNAIVIGGAIEGQSSPECAMHAAEIFDPDTETWTTVASMARPRIYHSTAVLLPDGRVLTAGGEDSHSSGGQRSAEIYSPSYLFRGPRPTIAAAPLNVAYDSIFSIDTAEAASIDSVALMRPGAVTHNFDQNQRYIPLFFSRQGNRLNVTSPVDGNMAPPGYYMLFIVDDDGVPSEAAWILVGSVPAEICNDGIDNDEDGLTDGDDPDCRCRDNDNDGVADCVTNAACNPDGQACGDCNDLDPGIYPGATELCDFLDNDCDGAVDESFDVDGDGFTACVGDCDDSNAAVNPAAAEMCDTIDNDCDALTDEDYLVLLDETFDDEPVESDPPGWFDTGAGNSLVETDLFHVLGEDGQPTLGTHSQLTNIHSHYLSPDSPLWANYLFSGRMRILSPDGGIGITVLSDYPNSDRYYRLRRFAGIPVLHMTAHGTTLNCDVEDTGVDIADGRWYRFLIEAGAMLGRVRAKVWAEGDAEPASWQQTCVDTDEATRRIEGTVGVWSMGPHDKLWDDLVVQLNEGLPDTGEPCGTMTDGMCELGVTRCDFGTTICVGEIPPSDEVCDGIDNDCDGATDEELSTSESTCGFGVCANVGELTCANGMPTDTCEPLPPPSPDDLTCDGIDEDCDGLADDDYPTTSTSCGVGACAAVGEMRCEDAAITDTCQPLPPLGKDDAVCDGIDADCDGLVDEEFVSRPSSCGQGVCASTGTLSCQAGVPSDSCQPLDPQATQDTSCDGIDEDCDGGVDEDYAVVMTFCGVGACAATGERTCQAGSESDSCEPLPPVSADDASCDGVDSDCDGGVDEDHVSIPTSCGVGICAREGEQACVDGGVVDSCAPGDPLANQDLICDGLDEDCDGAVDEDFATAASQCGLGACAGNTGVVSCVEGGVLDTCDPLAGSSPETCDGLDNDCDGLVDDDDNGVDSDLDGVANICDNCPQIATTNHTDFDGDGQGDACDLDDGRIHLVYDGERLLEWALELGFDGWNVYRGNLSVLQSNGQYTQSLGTGSLAGRWCNVDQPELDDSIALDPGQVVFYLVTGVAAGVESDLGTDSSGVVRPNDRPCPAP